MTFRADELHRRHPLLPWLAELERSGRVERIDLERLDAGRDARRCSTAILGRAADRRPRRPDPPALGRQPVLRRGAARGRRGRRGRPPAADARARSCSRGSSPCPNRAQTVIGVAAVAGRRVDHDLLAQVAGMDDADLLDGLRTAVGSQVLVDRAPAATARRATTRSATPCSRRRPTTTSCRASGSGSIGRSPRRSPSAGPGSGAIAAGHWAELAYHWSAARDDRRAFEASIRAGEAAARAFAFADARRHDERALELWSAVDDPEDARRDRPGRRSSTEPPWRPGWPATARRSVALRREAVAALGPDADPIRLGTMLERLGRALWTNAETEAALEAHEAAVAVMPADPPTPELARVLSGYGQILMLLDRWTESLGPVRAGRRDRA